MDIFTVCFFGHRSFPCSSKLESTIEQIIESLISEHDYVDFLIGRDGDFDFFISTILTKFRMEKHTHNFSHIWIMPYSKAEYTKNKSYYEKYYDEIEICNESSNCHPKNAFSKRNHSMIDRSDLCIFYVENTYGGSWEALQYAKKKNKSFLNLADTK